MKVTFDIEGQMVEFDGRQYIVYSVSSYDCPGLHVVGSTLESALRMAGVAMPKLIETNCIDKLRMLLQKNIEIASRRMSREDSGA